MQYQEYMKDPTVDEITKDDITTIWSILKDSPDMSDLVVLPRYDISEDFDLVSTMRSPQDEEYIKLYYSIEKESYVMESNGKFILSTTLVSRSA